MSARSPSAVAETTAGRVRGRDGCTFLGIPYAAPPVGARRWAPPAPVESREGELDAVAAGPCSNRRGPRGWAYGIWGLLDQLAVLAWVEEEIAASGGDPGAGTLGGQSAGAAAVADLLVSPAAEGLFTQAFLHSPPLPEA